MARIAGVDLPRNKRLVVALTYIHGIGLHSSKKICKQLNISENKRDLTLRGFHFQLPPFGEHKLICCVRGEIHNIVVDVRKDSETYLEWQSFCLNEELYIAVIPNPNLDDVFGIALIISMFFPKLLYLLIFIPATRLTIFGFVFSFRIV